MKQFVSKRLQKKKKKYKNYLKTKHLKRIGK